MSANLLDKLPSGKIIAKDLSVDKSLVPGNPYCRYSVEDGARTYCSQDLWEDADEKYVIPEGSTIPRPHVKCESCGEDTWVKDETCARCGKPVFVCPADGCEAEVHGKPDNCPECGAGYKWE